jgi:hypothetical protein
MKQNTHKSTYITIRIYKHNNTKYIICKLKQKHTKHTTMYAVIKKETKEYERM